MEEKVLIKEEQPIQNSGIGILAFILSIIGFMTGYLYIGILFDIAAIVLAIIALKKSKNKSAKKRIVYSRIDYCGMCFYIYVVYLYI